MRKKVFLALFPLMCVPVLGAPQKPQGPHASIIGKWRVTSDNPNDIRNHTYEFLRNNTCVEKYRTDQMAGPIDEPPQSVEMDIVITYRYKYLQGRRYRLYPVTSVAGGQPTHWAPFWRILDISITGSKAAVYTAARQDTKIERALGAMIGDVQGRSGLSNKAKTKSEQQTWLRVP